MLEKLKKFGIIINNKQLIDEALTHSSFANEHNCRSYERLEFLGDAVLEAVISEYFYQEKNLDEGKMSKIRASFVCEKALCFYAKKNEFDKYIKLGNGQEKKDSIIADIFESIIAVIYLDCGYDKVHDFIYKIIVPYIKKDYLFFDDYKSLLQEMTQTTKKTLNYKVIKETGPAHDKLFKVEVIIDGLIYGIGKGKSKKEAEQQAAFNALKKQAK